ncbi:hypothetical protein RND81_04G000600 [Saponaria officinalis]|uniref:PB1-like domain-containing protein n=1 Tax=Saponaria officinalis TaxID=3572 RepID=A0AAW1LHR2_SAPOF
MSFGVRGQSKLVTVLFWHGGLFKKVGNKTYYVGGKIKNFEEDSDELCWFCLEELALKCDIYKKINRIYYLLPGKSLEEGLRKVYNDKEVLEMIDIVAKNKVIDLYVEHGVDQPVILEDPQTKNTPTKNIPSPKKA